MKINILMLLLFMIINNLVLTKVAIIQNIIEIDLAKKFVKKGF